MSPAIASLLIGAALAAVAAGCGSGEDGVPAAVARSAPPPKPAHCPPELTNCRAASGRILWLEAVDPDGDGDAHFILASSQGVSAPGTTIVDVERELRPHPLPGVGDRISAAGPVYRGSYGQLQIEAVKLNVSRRP